MPDRLYLKDTAQYGPPSSVGETQFNDFYYQKKALIEMAKEQYFGQMSSTISMPKHMGKKIKRYHYIPLLDDANINDQGIDAAGMIAGVDPADPDILFKATAEAYPPSADGTPLQNPGLWVPVYFTSESDVKLTAEAAADLKLDTYFVDLGYTVPATASAIAAGWTVTLSAANGPLLRDGTGTATGAVPNTGNLYGSSKDVGTIVGKLPALGEHGGRVNRVGFRRMELEGSFNKFGFFDEYTKESIDFDTDSELRMHINRESLRGANEMTEDALQVDLLNAAGVIRFGGTATSMNTVTGNDGVESLLTYEDLMRLSIDLDDNRCPKNTKMITGSRMVDTKTIDGARYMYIGSELIPMFKRMTDLFGEKAFISVEQYASAGNIARGEIGIVDQFRLIVVPEMMHWAASGTVVGTDTEGQGNFLYRTSLDAAGTEKYNVYPALVIGSESFVNIGFQTDGKSVKFKIKHRKPESEGAYTRDDPFGETGFTSIKWFYGFMALRPERIALCLTVAEV